MRKIKIFQFSYHIAKIANFAITAKYPILLISFNLILPPIIGSASYICIIMDSRKNTLTLNDISLGYRSRGSAITVAEGINASLRSGELTCLLGPNGAGKSTLLRTIAGFIRPLSGYVEIEGRKLEDYSREDMSRLVSVVLTDRFNLPDMSVRQLISLGRSPYTGFWGTLSKDDARDIDEVMTLTATTGLSQRLVDTLSDGERQKVMIAKALAQHTPIILLDEPTAFLDFPSKVETMSMLRRLSAEQGKTVLLTTHDIEIALQLADRIWMLDRSNGFIDGIPEDIMISGQLSDFFCNNIISFDINTSSFHIELPESREEISIAGSGVIHKLAARALRRSGYRLVEAVSHQTADIIAENGCISFHGRPMTTIAAMLKALSDAAD